MAKNERWHYRRFLRGRFKANRRYKDRLFRFLFRDKKDLLELYNAVNESSYTDAEKLEIITLEDAIFMKMKNDLSFLIEEQMILYEHQSTYSPNMPLRGLWYFSRQYEGWVAEQGEDIYGSKQIKLPTPKYVVFYNGRREQADYGEQYLSESFEGGFGSGCLECKAVMLNINRGHNQELMGKCRRLWEYSEFVAEVNAQLAKKTPLKTAILRAIDTCVEKGILEDVLRKNKAEVLHMFLTEYDEKKHMKAVYQEGYEEGEQAGYSKGEQAGYHKGEKAGQRALLEKLVQKKLGQGKKAAEIAKELEIEIAAAEEIISSLK